MEDYAIADIPEIDMLLNATGLTNKREAVTPGL